VSSLLFARPNGGLIIQKRSLVERNTHWVACAAEIKKAALGPQESPIAIQVNSDIYELNVRHTLTLYVHLGGRLDMTTKSLTTTLHNTIHLEVASSTNNSKFGKRAHIPSKLGEGCADYSYISKQLRLLALNTRPYFTPLPIPQTLSSLSLFPPSSKCEDVRLCAPWALCADFAALCERVSMRIKWKDKNE
jgi:hypothetical protein